MTNNEMKNYEEQKETLQARMKEIVDNAKKENRSITAEEKTEFDTCKTQIEDINTTIECEKQVRAIVCNKDVELIDCSDVETREIKLFANYIRGEVEQRSNFDKTTNDDIIPETISKKIIDKVVEICSIFAGSDKYHIKGKFSIPKYGKNEDDDIQMTWKDDFQELSAHAGKFTTITLDGFLAGALVLIGRKLINSTDIDLVNWVVNKMAQTCAIFIEKSLLLGGQDSTGTATVEGAIASTNVYTSIAYTGITFDDLVMCQSKIKTPLQKNCKWVMNRNTYAKVCLLKDDNGRPLIEPDATLAFPFRLLGKPIEISEHMEDIGEGKKPILYLDYSGLAVNIHEDMNIEILREKYADQHAIGIILWLEFDSKVEDEQKIVVFECPSST